MYSVSHKQWVVRSTLFTSEMLLFLTVDLQALKSDIFRSYCLNLALNVCSLCLKLNRSLLFLGKLVCVKMECDVAFFPIFEYSVFSTCIFATKTILTRYSVPYWNYDQFCAFKVSYLKHAQFSKFHNLNVFIRITDNNNNRRKTQSTRFCLYLYKTKRTFQTT